MAKLADLQLATGARKRFTFPHAKLDGSTQDVTVEIRILTTAELDAARKNALSTVKDLSDKLKDGKTDEEKLAEARTIEILAAALMDPEKPSEPWATPMQLAQTLHPGAIALLSRAYQEHQDECGPFVRDITDEHFEALVEQIAEEASADPLALYASPLRNACIITMARELRALRIEKSSRSSASSGPSTSGESVSLDEAALSDSVKDHAALIDRLNDEIGSLKFRVMQLESARVPVAAVD